MVYIPDWNQDEIGEWGDRTFGKPKNTMSLLFHIEEEMIEFLDSENPSEAADVMILLLQHAHRNGYDLLEEVDKKMGVNVKRKWDEPNEQGVVHHIKEDYES